MKALITGITGQDGSYLAEYLLALGYEVVGLLHREARLLWWDKLPLEQWARLRMIGGSLLDQDSIRAAVRRERPDEIYNLGGMAFVPPSWDAPGRAFDLNTRGLAFILDAVLTISPETRVYQAGTSEMYGDTPLRSGEVEGEAILCDEEREMRPVSPYAVAKYAAHQLCRLYRKRGVYAVGGILMNHESPRRGPEMVTRKISRWVAQWARGQRPVLRLGSLEQARDWTHAGFMVRGMHAMLQQKEPDDYVLGSGAAHTVREFLMAALSAVDLNEPIREAAEAAVVEDERFRRPTEPRTLVADASKARARLQWQISDPHAHFKALVQCMVHSDMASMGVRG